MTRANFHKKPLMRRRRLLLLREDLESRSAS